MGASAAVDPRTACPACGGPVHPIAGRCKHCKADLTRLRAGHAPVAAPAVARPALVALGGGNGSGNGHGPGHGQAAPAGSWPTPLGMPPPGPASTTTVSAATHTPGDDTPSTWSTRWPLLVAALAIVAIVASVAMLLFGGNNDEKTGSKAKRNNGPAPELMPTDPGAHQVAPNGGQFDPNDPALPTPTIPDPAPPPPPAPTPPSPSANLPRDIEDFMRQSATALCERVTSCGGFDETVTTLCQMAPSMIPQMASQLESMCPDFDGTAARECVDSLSRFPCPSGNGGTDMMAMQNALMGLSGCQRVCPQAYRGWTPPDPDDVDDP
jgi:hypothetical protein